jgi:integrase
MKRKNRSAATSKYYRYNIEKHLADWLNEPLTLIGKDRKRVRERHVSLTEQHGPSTADATMRGLRVVYRHERRVNSVLPECPVDSRDFNGTMARELFVAVEQLPEWKAKVEGINNPVRRDLQIFLLFSGMRRTAACEARLHDFDEARRVLHVPRPKGGERRAFDLPLSDFLLELLIQRREQNALLYPDSLWIFPADSKTGRVTESKVPGLPSAHMLRHSYATHAASAGVPYVDLQLLLNHKLRDITGTYLHQSGVLERLREQQEQISRYLLEHMNKPTAKKDRSVADQPIQATLKQDNRTFQQEVTPCAT